MLTFNEEERTFIYSIINDLHQNWNYRSIEPELLASMLTKFKSSSVDLTEQESGRLQCWIRDKAELYAHLANERLQHILQEQNNQGFGVDHGSKSNFFNGPKMYNLCKSILAKLSGV